MGRSEREKTWKLAFTDDTGTVTWTSKAEEKNVLKQATVQGLLQGALREHG
jgi:hypothetical protein